MGATLPLHCQFTYALPGCKQNHPFTTWTFLMHMALPQVLHLIPPWPNDATAEQLIAATLLASTGSVPALLACGGGNDIFTDILKLHLLQSALRVGLSLNMSHGCGLEIAGQSGIRCALRMGVFAVYRGSLPHASAMAPMCAPHGCLHGLQVSFQELQLQGVGMRHDPSERNDTQRIYLVKLALA